MNSDRKRPAQQRLSRFSHADRTPWQNEAAASKHSQTPAAQPANGARYRPSDERRASDLSQRLMARGGPAATAAAAQQKETPPVMPAGNGVPLDASAPADGGHASNRGLSRLLYQDEPLDSSINRPINQSLEVPRERPVAQETAPAKDERIPLGKFAKFKKKTAAKASKPWISPRLRQRARSAVGSSVKAIARNTRREELQANYTRALVALHQRILDRKIEALFFHPTAIPASRDNGENTALFTAANVARPVYDGPVPRHVFDWIMAALPADLKEYAFVDFRAQRGRAMLMASRRNFENITGYEYDAKTFDDLQMNVAQFPRSLMVCRNVEVVRGDRDGLAVPNQPAVLYFSNAYREPFLSLIMSQVTASYRLNPRRIYIILENPGDNTAIGQDGIFYNVKMPARQRGLMRFLSPVKAHIYRSLV